MKKNVRFWLPNTTYQYLTEGFIERYPQWIAGPEAVVDYSGQTAIRFCLLNPSSTAKLIVLAHAQNLQVLATFQE